MDEILISRIRKEAYEQGYQDGMVEGYNLAGAKLIKRKRGKWKQGYCSECGYNWGKDAPIASVPNFCPNCGAEMSK